VKYLLTSAVIAVVLSLLPTAALAQGGAAISPVTVDGVSVYPALFSAQYRSALTTDGARGADGRPVEWWRFLDAAGGCATVRVDATDFTPQVQLRNGAPGGQMLGEGRAPVTVGSVPDSGWYYVRVGSQDARTGPYALVIDRC
jgi:hypothetical protein